jgi:hypothetical protein
MAPAVLTVAVAHEHGHFQRSISNFFAQTTTLKDEIGTHKVFSLASFNFDQPTVFRGRCSGLPHTHDPGKHTAKVLSTEVGSGST